MPLSTVLGAQSLVQPAVCTTATRPASPYTGQAIYDTTLSQVLVYNGTAFAPVSRVLQVVSTTKTSTFTSAVTAFTDITGLSVTITPSSATSTILVMADVSTYQDASASSAWARLVRGSTGVYLGDAAGSRTQASHMIGWASGSNGGTPIFMTFVDSPATTSATTYKVQVGNQSGTTYVNRTSADSDSAVYPRTASSITVMEISA